MVVKHDTGNHWLDLPDFYAAVSMMDVVFCQEIYLSLTVIFHTYWEYRWDHIRTGARSDSKVATHKLNFPGTQDCTGLAGEEGIYCTLGGGGE